MSSPPLDAVFISWTPQWRADRFSVHFRQGTVIPGAFAAAWPWPARYLAQSLATTLYLLRRRPKAVIFTNPPPVTGLVLVVLSWLLRFQVWADSHGEPWSNPRWMRWGPIHRWVLSRCDGGLFHNPQTLADFGHETPTPLLSWTPPLLDLRPAAPRPGSGTYVATVMSYHDDEPVGEIFAAAALLPDVIFKLTGNASPEVRAGAPANVEFTGFVSVPEFERLVQDSAVVLCLTMTPDTMQQGIADALEAGVPGITNDNPTMRAWRDGTSTCDLVDWRSPPAIAAAVQRAFDGGAYDEAGRRRLVARSHEQFEALRRHLDKSRK